jgi:hypothetical protein
MTDHYFIHGSRNTVLLSLYQQRIRSHLEAICKARHGLIEVQKMLASKTRLRPIECDNLSSSLQTLLKAVRTYEELLRDGNNLPQSAAPKRYKVFISLNHTGRLVGQIFPLLASFRRICLHSSPESNKMLAELRGKVNILVRVSEALEPETKEMLTKVLSENFITLPVGSRNIDHNN